MRISILLNISLSRDYKTNSNSNMAKIKAQKRAENFHPVLMSCSGQSSLMSCLGQSSLMSCSGQRLLEGV